MTVKLRALRQLTGDYGRVVPGQVFETDEETAESLEARALAERHYDEPPPVVIETKPFSFVPPFLPSFHTPMFPQSAPAEPQRRKRK